MLHQHLSIAVVGRVVVGGGIQQEVVVVMVDISAGCHIGGLLVGHEVVTRVEHIQLGRVLCHLMVVVVLEIVDQSRVVGGGARLGEDHTLLDGVWDHVGKLDCVLGGEGGCVVLESHYLACFMGNNVCLR